MKNFPVLLLVILCLWNCNQADQKLDYNDSIEVFKVLKAPSQLMYADIDPFISVDNMSVNEVKGLLRKILEADQQYRDSLNNGNQNHLEFYRKKIAGNDEANLLILDKIIQKFGWPGIALFGEERANTAWLIIWHHRDKSIYFANTII